MSIDGARKEAEALRYRARVRLTRIVREARRSEDPETERAALDLRNRLDALVVGPNEWETGTAAAAVVASEAEIGGFEKRLGLTDDRVLPRWMRFATWSLPVLLVLFVLGVLFGRRRRKKAVSASSLRALDAASVDRPSAHR